MLRTRSLRRRFDWLLALAASGVAAGPSGAITGVCPDGSIFVVAREELIPCAQAKEIETEEVPPLRPEYLPRPYTWQVYNETQNPNNAYNLVDSARQVRALRDGRLPEIPAAEGDGATPDVAAPPPRAQRAVRAGPVELGLSDGELRDLFLIVELSQDRAPASFTRESATGEPLLEVSLAWSEAFQTRFTAAWQGNGPEGHVILFSSVARSAESFYANFTFAQGYLAFQPKVDDPRQFGLLQGRLGPLGADEVALGYVVLPDRMDVGEPIDVYWDDRRVEAVFQP